MKNNCSTSKSFKNFIINNYRKTKMKQKKFQIKLYFGNYASLIDFIFWNKKECYEQFSELLISHK